MMRLFNGTNCITRSLFHFTNQSIYRTCDVISKSKPAAMPRLFVRDFSKSTNKSELEALFCKLCPVDDVYIPEPTVTGINRNFAIVTLNCAEDVVEKCIKAFHNSNWNGSRIRVELANVWYKNRFENERLIESTTSVVKTTVVVDEKPTVLRKSVVTLKKSYLLPLIKVSLKPRKSSDIQPKRRNVIACGVKTILDDSCVTSNDELSSESESDEEEIALPEVKAPAAIAKATTVPATTAVVPVVSAASSHLQGGGSRKGFGTLLHSTVKLNAEKTPVLKPIKKATVDTKVERFDEYSNGGLDDDSGVSDGEYDDDSDQDGERCVAPAELEETSLLRERQRALALMQSVLGGGGGPASEVAVGEAENPTTSNDNGAVPAAVPNEVVDGANSSSSSGGGSGSMMSRNGWNSVVMVRFNPGKAPPKKVGEAPVALPEPTSSVSVGKVSTETAAEQQSTLVNGSTESGSKATEIVQLDKLKSIFYKEGGVWWDDSGSVATGEAVMRGTVDPLFLEAEKFGIDIRAASESKEESSMLFGFFDESEQVAAVHVESSSADKGEGEAATSHVQRHEEVSTADAHQASLTGAKRAISSMSVEEMLQTAKKFCRIKSVDEVTKEWNEGRDKLVLDYKRKFKDARKRNNGVVIAETVPITTVRNNNTKKITAHAKSKSRGGVKHSRKK